MVSMMLKQIEQSADLSLQFSELNARLEENYIEFKDILFQLQNEAEKVRCKSWRFIGFTRAKW